MAKLTSSLVISLTDRVSGPARGIMSALGRMKHSADGFNRNQMAMASGLMSNLKGLLAAAAAYASLTEGISGTIGAAIKFEDSMSDIRKVVDFKTPQQFKQMGDDVLAMSSKLGMSTSSIAAIVAAWGQANAKPEELLKLTELTAKASVAWDTTAAETGDALAKIRTALGLTVEQTGLVADAINHLGNASASGTKDLLAFSRGLSSGKIAGFAAKETLAFGAAMISSGFEAEVAETSFRNMAFALTSGSKATKDQRSAFKRLGFDAKKVSKAMQKDAVGTTLAVLDAISALPKDEQGAIAASLFGKEARAVPALLGNLPELRRLLGEVADDAKYAGSAQREFDEASKRTSVNLAKLKSVLSGIGIAIGQMALPTLNDWMKTLSDTLLTLDKRVTIFDDLSAGMKGFMSGLGFEGGTIGEQFGKLYDGIFGRLQDFEKDTDNLGAIFAQFRQYGADVRAFGSAVSASIGDIEKFFHLDSGTIGETLGMLGENGFKLAMAAVGITLVAGALRKLAGAMLFLTGVSTVLGGAKGIVKLLAALGGATAAAATAGAATTVAKSAVKPVMPKVPTAIASGWDKMTRLSKLTTIGDTIYGFYKLLTKNPSVEGQRTEAKSALDGANSLITTLFGEKIGKDLRWGVPEAPKDKINPLGDLLAMFGYRGNMPASERRAAEEGDRRKAYEDNTRPRSQDYATGVTDGFLSARARLMRRDELLYGPSKFPGKEADDVYTPPAPPQGNYWLDQIKGMLGASEQSSGPQQVTMTNPPQPNVYNVSASVVVNEAANGADVARQFASNLKTAIAGTHADMNHQAHA